MVNIQEFENNLNMYNQQISAKKNEIAKAERELIVAQTQLKNYEQQAKDIEEECFRLTGKSINELEIVIAESMAKLDKIMKKVSDVFDCDRTGMTEKELNDTEQFIADNF